METVEVVIRLKKERYDELQKNKHLPNRLSIEKAITDGTLLPKGHDDLIERAQVTNYDNLYDVPTVIEADKEVEK